ncbi:MAG: hypothetical protein KAQ92_01120 [Candidatus Aenigmarchaeota archaeon]|nr:hypothetical protein [Candidatus Aenigmarchaeota archaeon]
MRNYLLLFVTAILIFSCGCVSSDNLCNGHSLGDSWQSEDGCNTCSCTKEGTICTLKYCLEVEEEPKKDTDEFDPKKDTDEFYPCQIDEECMDIAMTISRCMSMGKCVDNTCIFECIDGIHPDDPFETEKQTRFDYSEGQCMDSFDCIEAGEGCGGGHSTCTSNPEKYEGMMSTCDINMDHPTNNGYSCTCVIEESKCGWVKD